MKTKQIIWIVILFILLLFVLCNLRFLAGFELALILFLYFGEVRVKKFLSKASNFVFSVGLDLLNSGNAKLSTVVLSSSVVSTGTAGIYQIKVVTEQKIFLLKPSKVSQVPDGLKVGQEITIQAQYALDGLSLVKKDVIIAAGQTYEVV